MAKSGLTPVQCELAKKYMMENYVVNLRPGHVNTKEEIFNLEKETRGQANNDLWKLVRLNRRTASKSSTCCLKDNDAIKYGILHEELVKQDETIMNSVCCLIEEKLQKRVKKRVLDCGLFLSKLGLNSASPDAYFLMEDDNLVTLEIKCPLTYKDSTWNSIRSSFNNTRKRYRVKRTAFIVNKTGPLNLDIVKKDDHWRQMQHQMYVSGAILAVYLVKIGNIPAMLCVEPDNDEITRLRINEEGRFEDLLIENQKMRYLTMEKNRYDSFKESRINEADRVALAKDGLYYWYGNVLCFFCNKQFSVETGVENIIKSHTDCDKTGNIKHVRVIHTEYINKETRLNSLISLASYAKQQCLQLAEQGFFHDCKDNQLKLFCCDGRQSHTSNCDFRHV